MVLSLHLVGGAEAVKEVDERHGALDGGQVGHHARSITSSRGGGQEREAGLPRGHDVALVAEDGKAMGTTPGRTRGIRRGGVRRDFVHVGDHQQQALGRGEGGGERARRQRPVHGARGAPLGLHLGDAHLLAEQVQPTCGRPFVGDFRHGRRRRDGVYRRHVAEGVSNVGRGGISIDGHGFRHFLLLLIAEKMKGSL